MTLFAAFSFAITMAVLAALPSASVLLVVARSASHGFRSGAATAAGIVCGDLVFVVLALLGMTLLAEATGGLFVLLRYVAGAYLIWLGLRLFRSTAPSFPAEGAAAGASNLVGSFSAGLLLTLGDVKAIFFYASLFPAFVDLQALRVTDVIPIITITVSTVGGVKLAYAAAADRLVRRMPSLISRRGPRIAAGSILASAGVYLIGWAW